jgi:hypothetical protein
MLPKKKKKEKTVLLPTGVSKSAVHAVKRLETKQVMVNKQNKNKVAAQNKKFS